MLGLRRTPRRPTPPDDTTAVVSASSAQPAPVTAEPQAIPAAPPRQVSKRQPAPTVDFSWDRLIGEAMFCGLALIFWVGNGLLTVIGVMNVVGWPVLGAFLGLLLHGGISRVEVSFWSRWREPEYLFGLVVAVMIDAGTSWWGGMTFIRRTAPDLLQGAPESIWSYRDALFARVAPAWIDNVVVVAVLAIMTALFAERLLRRYWRNLRATWAARDRRPALAT